MFLSTTGSDLDVVVKIIDVYPATDPDHPEMAGYQLPISLDIFRGRYRHDISTPQPATPGLVDEYNFRLPTVNWIFKRGHKIMVQVQSSLFPLYDRNPQSYVQNIFFAKASDFQSSVISLNHSIKYKSAVFLPIVKAKGADSSCTR